MAGGAEKKLTTSYLSSPKLLEELNPILEALGFGDDALTPHCVDSPQAPALLCFGAPTDDENSEDKRAGESEGLATFFKSLLDGTSILPRHQGCEVAVLFRRFT